MEERDESLGGKRWKKKIARRDRERVTGMRRGKSKIGLNIQIACMVSVGGVAAFIVNSLQPAD